MAITFWAYATKPLPSNLSKSLAYSTDQLQSNQPPPLNLPNLSNEKLLQIHNATIFITIISYRDSELSKTVKDLFLKASNANRLFVGILWQGLNDDIEINELEDKDFNIGVDFNTHIRLLKMHASQGIIIS
jgi:hypothetical protein